MAAARLIEALAAVTMDPTSGLPAAGGTAYFYLKGTTTPTTVYGKDDKSIIVGTSVALDDGGTARVYADQDLTVRVYNANGVLVSYLPSISRANVTTSQVNLEQGAGSDGESFTATDLEHALLLWVTSGGTGDWKYKRSAGTGVVARYIKAKLGQLLDVLDFGAVGDNSTLTNATAFTNALAQLQSTGGALLVPAGIYLTNAAISLASLNGVTIIGEGAGSIIRANAANQTVFDCTASTRLTFRDIRVDGNGTAGTATGTGIALDADCSDVTLDNVRISGTDGTHGHRFGVAIAGADCRVIGCEFELLFGAGSAAIKIDGSTDVYIGAGTRIVGGSTLAYGVAAIAAGATRPKLDGLRISSATDYGVYLLTSHEAEVRGGHIASCGGPGIAIDGGDDVRVVGAYVNACTDGILVRAGAGGSPARFKLLGNTVTGNSLRGINIACTVTTAASAGLVQGNQVVSNGREGILAVSDDTLYDGNNVQSNSTAGASTYSAIKLTSAYVSSADRGGANNTVGGNCVRGTHLACLEMSDSGGGGAVGHNGVDTTRVLANDFPPLGSSVVHIRYAGVNNIYGILGQSSNPRYLGYAGHGGVRPYMKVTGIGSTIALTWADLTCDLIVDNSTGACTFTLPDGGADSLVDEYNGARCRIFKIGGAANLLTVNAAGTNDIYDWTGAAVTAGLKDTAKAVCAIELEFYNGTWWVASRSLLNNAEHWITV